eukprot:1186608-Prorocentrum_minimum.AAC.5
MATCRQATSLGWPRVPDSGLQGLPACEYKPLHNLVEAEAFQHRRKAFFQHRHNGLGMPWARDTVEARVNACGPHSLVLSTRMRQSNLVNYTFEIFVFGEDICERLPCFFSTPQLHDRRSLRFRRWCLAEAGKAPASGLNAE